MRIVFFLRPLALMLIALLALSACKTAEERANEHYESGLNLLASGDVDRAILEFRNVFQLDATHREARQSLGRVYLEEKNDKQRAYRQFLRVVEQYPDDIETRILLTDIALGTGNWEEVERHGAHVEGLAPEDPRVQAISLARAYGRAARAEDEAIRRDVARDAADLLNEQPNSPFLRAVSIDDALREGELEKALESIDWMLERDPENQNLLTQRLSVLAQSGDDAAVETQLRDMIAKFPENDTHKATLIRFYMSRNNIDEAEAFLRTRAEETGDVATRMDLVRFLIEVRGTDAGREELRAAVTTVEDSLSFQLVLAGLDFEQGDRQKAIADLEALVQDNENTPQVLEVKATLARMQLAVGNEVGARARVAEILTADESQPDALKMQAVWQIEADETDNAIAGLRLALDREPEDAAAMTLMAQAYRRAGRPELAKDFMALAVEASGHAPAETISYARLLINEERYLPAEDILLKALRLTPQNLDLLVLTGQLYLQMEDLGRAEQVVRTLRNQDNPLATQAANALEAERISLQSGIDDAIAYLEELAQSANASLASQITVVRARLASGNTEGALNLVRELRTEQPDAPAIAAVEAGIEALLGNLDTAEEIYQGLLEDDPQRSAGIWLEMARLKMQQQDPEASRATIDEALTHLPDNPQLLWAKASYLEQDGKIDGAVEIYERLYEINSGSVVVANNLASLLGTYKQDEASLERAWVVARRFQDAEVPALQDTYGWILHRRGKSEEALSYLEAAAQGLPGDPIVQYHLAEIYATLERRDDALKQYQAAVKIAGPTDQRDQIVRARQEIQRLLSLVEN
ncbi:tetratricopeptide repeat protein [uncultured Roseobacter sp.]|uniref:tetratricopeptide repeat protein n=1 Tax=uncultured Roseobacter sp. TaxID=114847 RepID=UPI00263393F2|nr:tetratricopeptide repeat protein [uncultured Roseobacter sp.]